MSQSLPILIAASLFAGGVGAVATTVLVSPGAPSPSGDTQVADASGDLLVALDDLRAQNRELNQRLEALEMQSELAPIAGAPRTSAATPSDVEAMVQEALAAVTAGEAGVAPTPAFASAVHEVIERIEEQDRLEREQRRLEAEAQRLENRLAELRSELGLDPNQVDGLRTVFQDERERMDAMREKMRDARESGDMEMGDMRSLWGESRDATNQALQGVLTAAQYEQYQESQQQNRRWGGGRGGRGGGDGPGGGGRGN